MYSRPAAMTWCRNSVVPKELQKRINDFRFDGTPSAKAMKAFDISYRTSSIICENGTWLEASYIECTACEESAYTHFTYLWFGDDSCPDCENNFETSPFLQQTAEDVEVVQYGL